MTETAHKSRLPRTGTLVLIAVVLLIGGGAMMVWLPYHRNQQAIAEIERLGGKAVSEILRPFWMPNAVDDEYLTVFERVIEVDLIDTQISDAGLHHLRGLTNLEYLWLFETQVGDAGLMHLRGLTKLGYLSLDDTHVSDAGIEHLRGMIKLQSLYLNHTQVTKAGIEKLQKALPSCDIDWTIPAK